MSRFYEALKQASRSLHHAPEGAESEDPDFAAILHEPPVSGFSEIAALPAEETLVETSEQPLPPAATPQNGSLGILTQAVLDKKAPLIPNSVEPLVLEHYRLLRTKIMQQQAEKPFRSLLVTSADPKEGKTLTVLNLALTFSMLPSYKVLVVDGDIRRGNLSHWLGISDRPGLSDLLEGSAKLEEVVLKSAEIPFYFVGRGKSQLSPPELLHSTRWPNQIKKMSSHFDLVLVDSPPLNLVTDSQILASGCEAVLVVARAFVTSRKSLEKISQDFQQFRVIGTVLNGGAGVSNYRRYRSYYPKGRG